jgi:endo-1,4-beta-xylanase
MGLRWLGWIGVAAVAMPFFCVTVRAEERKATLREAAGHQFLIGAAITSKQLNDPATEALILKQFDCLTAEYEFMPQFLQPEPGHFTFEAADRIVAFAQEHGLPLTGHMLYWNQLTPPWMFEDAQHKPLSREQALANLKSHIETVMKHFKGKLSSWDVVNEAVSEKPWKPWEYLRDTPALRAIGDDYVQKAFEFAHAADPDVRLYYNDYNVENPVKLRKVIRLIRSLKGAGVRLDAIGIQGHWLLHYPDTNVIEAGIEALGKEGIKVLVTELDVDLLPRYGSNPYKAGIPAKVLEEEARRYAELFSIFKRNHDLIPRVTFWGVEDGQSWLNYNPWKGRTNYPLLFDRQLRAKPAFDAVINVLSKE